MVKELAATTFRTWGQLGRKLLQVPAPATVNWIATRRMVDASVPLFETQKAQWLELLAQSDNLLKPLQDPLRMDFGTHRWLSENIV